jgi:hypothetical protein
LTFLEAVERAASRAVAEVSAKPSVSADRTLKWMASRFDLARPADYFTQPQSLPLLALPWWLEESFRGQVDAGFQGDLIYSTINFYYFVRMLDDLMDGHPVEPAALPSMHQFHHRFTRPYSRYFEAESPFWPHFERLLGVTVETAAAEATASEITPENFLDIAARKPVAALIPVAAVCVRYDRLALLEQWEEMFVRFARWHQMRDDFLDWNEDAKAGSPTWLLTEAKARSRQGEPLAAWMAREGLVWVQSILRNWMDETIAAASALNSPALVEYLRQRDQDFSQQVATAIGMAEAFKALRSLQPSPR